MLKVTKKKAPVKLGASALIGRFVTLDTPHDYYVADFNMFAEITQCSILQTRKFPQILRAYFSPPSAHLSKNSIFHTSKMALVRPQNFPKINPLH